MMDAQELAKKLHNVLGQKTDGQGKPTPVSNETLSYAKGVIASLKSAVVSNAPGTILGVTAPGAPLSNGSGVAGIMAITPGPMIAETANGFNGLSGPQLVLEHTALIAYIGTALITFAPGQITGTCTNTPVSAGPLVAGAGSGGKLTVINGPGAAAAVAAALGSIGPDSLTHYNTLINYILEKAEASYAPGSVLGTCPAAGGPLAAGTATGGTIA